MIMNFVLEDFDKKLIFTKFTISGQHYRVARDGIN